MPCLVLDAMGVLFESADDVAELLVPFIQKNGGNHSIEAIESAYTEASLGRLEADNFWHRFDIDPDREDDFLALHRLNQGVSELLALAQEREVPVWCLSNDVGRWSQKLRQRLGIEERLAGSIISGDVGVRKPDAGIYQALLSASKTRSGDLYFVDDREKNVIAARQLGIESDLFTEVKGFENAKGWLDRVKGQDACTRVLT